MWTDATNPLILADPLGLAPYGKVDLNDPNSEMAQVSMAARMDPNHTQIQSDQNVAVYRIGEPPNHTYIAAANDPRGLHSEEILNAHIADPASGIDPAKVTGVYSERVPCVQTSSTGTQHNCAASLNQYPNLGNDIQWSLDPDRPNLGIQNAAAIQKAMANYPGPAPGLPGFTWVR